MGDPGEIGRELAKIHRPWLGYLWRCSQILTGVLLSARESTITLVATDGKRLAMQDIRISSLEQAENRRAGGISALAASATVAGSVGALLMKVFG